MRQLPTLPMMQPQTPKGHWYVHGWYNGKAYTRGPFLGEGEARAVAHGLFPSGSDWMVEELPTTNLARAKAMFRDRDLSKGMYISQAMSPHLTIRSPGE